MYGPLSIRAFLSLMSPFKQPQLRDQLYLSLDLLNGLPAHVLNAVAEQLVTGLSTLIKEHRYAITQVPFLSHILDRILTIHAAHQQNGA